MTSWPRRIPAASLRFVALTLRGSASGQSHRHIFGPVRERDEHLTWFGEAAYTITHNAQTLVVGGALQQERYDARDVAGFDYTYSIPRVFAQATVEPLSWAVATASGRVDWHDEYGTFISPRLSILLRPGAQRAWSVLASLGEGYFAPTPFTEEIEVVGLSCLRPLNNLKAERARGASLDVGATIRSVEVNATVLGSVVRDPVGIRAVSSDVIAPELLNLDRPTRTSGGELLARWHPEPFHVTATYTYVESREVDAETGARRRAPLTPLHQAGIVAAWELEETARAGIEIYCTGRQPLDDDAYRTESRPYVHIGVLVERRFGPARIFVNAENLLDVRQTKHDRLVRPAPGMGGRWTNDVWAPLEGRVAELRGQIRPALSPNGPA